MSSIVQARERVSVEPVYLVDVILPGDGAPVMRFAQRMIEVGAEMYEPYLMSVQCVGQSLHRRGDSASHEGMNIVLSNLPWRGYDLLIEAFDDYPIEGAECLLSECYMVDDAAGGIISTEAELLCRGILESPMKASMSEFTCGILSFQYRADIKQ